VRPRQFEFHLKSLSFHDFQKLRAASLILSWAGHKPNLRAKNHSNRAGARVTICANSPQSFRAVQWLASLPRFFYRGGEYLCRVHDDSRDRKKIRMSMKRAKRLCMVSAESRRHVGEKQTRARSERGPVSVSTLFVPPWHTLYSGHRDKHHGPNAGSSGLSADGGAGRDDHPAALQHGFWEADGPVSLAGAQIPGRRARWGGCGRAAMEHREAAGKDGAFVLRRACSPSRVRRRFARRQAKLDGQATSGTRDKNVVERNGLADG